MRHSDVLVKFCLSGCGIFLENVWACSCDLCTKPTILRRILVKMVITILPGPMVWRHTKTKNNTFLWKEARVCAVPREQNLESSPKKDQLHWCSVLVYGAQSKCSLVKQNLRKFKYLKIKLPDYLQSRFFWSESGSFLNTGFNFSRFEELEGFQWNIKKLVCWHFKEINGVTGSYRSVRWYWCWEKIAVGHNQKTVKVQEFNEC